MVLFLLSIVSLSFCSVLEGILSTHHSVLSHAAARINTLHESVEQLRAYFLHTYGKQAEKVLKEQEKSKLGLCMHQQTLREPYR